MKKISIVLAILAVFLVFSCSNAAGPVDNAGNPVDLAGSWSGTVAWKVDQVVSAPAIFTNIYKITGGGMGYYQDVQGTWVKSVETSPRAKNYDQIQYRDFGADQVAVTYKFVFNTSDSTTTESYVINADGGYVYKKVESKNYLAWDPIAPVPNTSKAEVIYILNDEDAYRFRSYDLDLDGDNDNAWQYGSVNSFSTEGIPNITWKTNSWNYSDEIAGQEAGNSTKTTTKTITVTEQEDGLYTENTTQVVELSLTGDYYVDSYYYTAGYTKETYPQFNKTNLNEYELSFATLDLGDYKQTVIVPAKETVKYQNDKTETLTFVVAKDGTYTLTSVIVETQAAADAAAETETHYAAPARKASTLTTTTTTTGTVAAWEVPATANQNASTQMALSAKSKKVEVVGTEDFLDATEDLASVSALPASTSFNIRIIKGDGKKDDTILTRLYIEVLDDEIIILDKAPEAAE